tara:strand:- start:46 stop:204 length:159 start_codon:yes stop_codon:yes gene_type:complete
MDKKLNTLIKVLLVILLIAILIVLFPEIQDVFNPPSEPSQGGIQNRSEQFNN